MDVSTLLTFILSRANLALSSAVAITAFSLLVYVLTHNLRSAVARAFCALIAFVIIVYAGDVVLFNVDNLEAAIPWLRFQWIGIALVPAAYLQLSDALLQTTNATSSLRRRAVLLSYAISLVMLLAALFTDLVVQDGVHALQVTHLKAGRLFWLFAVYFFVTVIWGAANIAWARRRCLTSTSRRRMTYLAVSFVAPGLGVFPYLLLASMPPFVSSNAFLLLLLIGNVGVAFMIVVMAYSVTYFGVLTPDRVVKHNLIHYLLRGPFVATCVVVVMLAVPRGKYILGVPRSTVQLFAVVGVIILLQVLINVAKPFIDRLTYRQDREEVTWIQALDTRLLTTTDLKQLLENLLTALCETLRVRTGFVTVMAGGEPHIETHCGSLSRVQQFVASHDLTALATTLTTDNGDNGGPETGRLVACDGFWVWPLRSETKGATLGILGVEATDDRSSLSAEEWEAIETLVHQAEMALQDRHLQQGVFVALRGIIPEIERIQRWRSHVRYSGSPPLQAFDDSPVHAPTFQQWVKDALSHYWGGPKLTKSPLLQLRIVKQALQDNDGNPAKALRAVLHQAIETLKPEGQRSMTTTEWILYNILEMRFIQGRRVRDIAERLAMSESDLYRKQRVAVEEVARTLAEMEQNNH